jgi:hypothetical protein
MSVNGRMRGGYALSIVLWIVAALLVGSATTLYFVKNGLRTSKLIEQKINAQLLAENTFELLQFYLKKGECSDNYVESALPKEAGEVFPKKMYVDGRKIVLKNGVTVTLKDTGMLFGVMAPPTGEMAQLAWPGNPRKQRIGAAAYLDWTDADSEVRLYGAEDQYYLRNGASVFPRNHYSPQALEELQAMRGYSDMNESRWEQFSQRLYVGANAFLNLMTVDDAMLACALDISREEAEALTGIRGNDPLRFKQRIQHLPAFDDTRFKFGPTKQFVITIHASVGEAVAVIESVIDVNYIEGHEITIMHYKNR